MLGGFETYDASIREAVVKITKAGIVFNKATAIRLGKPEQVELGIDTFGKRIAIVSTDKKTEQSLKFPLHPDTGVVRWSSKDILNEMYKIAEWDPVQSYRVTGEVIEKENAIIFDFNQAQPIKGRCRM